MKEWIGSPAPAIIVEGTGNFDDPEETVALKNSGPRHRYLSICIM